MGFGRVRIYTFSDDFKEKELYSGNDSVPKGSRGNISFRALYSNSHAAWILVSGDYDYGWRCRIRRIREKSYFLEISEKGVAVKAEFSRNFFWVKNMVVQGNHMFLGMDKVVADVNIEDKRITAYTPVSLEAEADIRKATARLSGLVGIVRLYFSSDWRRPSERRFRYTKAGKEEKRKEKKEKRRVKRKR